MELQYLFNGMSLAWRFRGVSPIAQFGKTFSVPTGNSARKRAIFRLARGLHLRGASLMRRQDGRLSGTCDSLVPRLTRE